MGEMIAKYWLNWFLGLASTVLALCYARLASRLKAQKAESAALKAGIRALLRDRIVQGYNHYTAKGCYPIYAREAMMDMYKQYAALGGNGVITDLVEDLKELPVEKREEKSA